MQLFYAPDITNENIYALSHEESTHCIGALRYRKGQLLTLTDGNGHLYEAEIKEIARKQVIVKIRDKKQLPVERSCKLHIAIAPTKNMDRFEWFLEKVTEIGIDEITPMITENSERKSIRPDRLDKIIVSAMKQSLKAYKPILNPLYSFEEILSMSHSDYQPFIANCKASAKELLKRKYRAGANAIILIGPEGDFTAEEIENAVNRGFESVSLGNNILRTETAGVVACHAVNFMNMG